MSAMVLAAVLAATVTGASPEQSPAERAISSARQKTAVTPDRVEPYVELAFALARRARETADPRFYEQGEAAVQEALRRVPDSYEARKARVWLLLGRHRFAEALEEARSLQARLPDDPQVYAFLVDAHVELGNYAEAEEAAQWLLDLRPGGASGLTRAAYLRELFGDLDGALELMRSALGRTPPEEHEERAWLLTQVGHLERLAGRLPAAEEALAQALAEFPGYHYALGERAHVHGTQGRHGAAVELLRQRWESAPHPENLYELAAALEKAGRSREARQAFRRFERAAKAESASEDNANRELVAYYADHAGRPAEALRVAERELGRRRDVHTRDAYAWALFRNGRPREARREIEAVLAVGVRDPGILAHARAIRSATRSRS
jgi:tetratricopeptide (TPR) repeat protein